MTAEKVGGSLVPCQGITSKDWHAWNNLMPPGPGQFHVVGEVLVPNPGVEPLLTPKEPQGFNPAILLLDLLLIQKPGMWPEVLVWKPARYDKVNAQYTQVQVFCGKEIIADMQVQIVT